MEDIKMQVYDINKQFMSQEKPLDPILFNRETYKLAEKMYEINYVMLLNKERADYSVFHMQNGCTIDHIQQELAETLQNRGNVVKIYIDPDSPIFQAEIWIKDGEETFMYALFDYTFGMIEVFGVNE